MSWWDFFKKHKKKQQAFCLVLLSWLLTATKTKAMNSDRLFHFLKWSVIKRVLCCESLIFKYKFTIATNTSVKRKLNLQSLETKYLAVTEVEGGASRKDVCTKFWCTFHDDLYLNKYIYCLNKRADRFSFPHEKPRPHGSLNNMGTDWLKSTLI